MLDLGKGFDRVNQGVHRRQIDFARPPLSEPLAFFEGHAYGNKTYTNGADRDAIVAPKFRDTMFEVLAGVDKLHFGGMEWGNEAADALALLLPLCLKLEVLDLRCPF